MINFELVGFLKLIRKDVSEWINQEEQLVNLDMSSENLGIRRQQLLERKKKLEEEIIEMRKLEQELIEIDQ